MSKPISTALKNHIRTASAVSVRPRLLAEWNLNRYYTVTADNTPAEDTDGNNIESFPIESIYQPNRPPAGINKALVGEAVVSPTYLEGIPPRRYYIGGPDDPYKYWASPEQSSLVSPYNISKVQPRIEYWEENGTTPKGVFTNKIVIGLEDSWARPDDWDIQWKNAAGVWATISTNPTIGTNGRVELWHNGSAWTTTKSYTGGTTVYGLRLTVRSMNKAGSFFNLIEISARLEKDLTADLVTTNDAMSLGEADFITPLGTLSSNTGGVTLFNDHQYYSSENEEGPYFGLIDKNVKMTLFYDYDLPLGGVEPVQQFEMYTDVWSANDESAEVTVSLTDGSKFMQEIKPPAVMYLNVTVQEVVWRLCDLMGFNDYVLTVPTDSPSSLINIFWTTGDETLWEVFQEISRGKQCAIYFDAYGKLNIKPREAAFDTAKAPVWTARELPSGTDAPDIVTVESESIYEANKVIVNYIPTDFTEEINGFATMTVVWEPESTLALRADNLQQPIGPDDTFIWLAASDAKVWHFEGVVNIEGEFIRYSGKRYSYYDGATKKTATVKSFAEQKKLDDKTPDGKKHLNFYNGALVIQERGLWNTEKNNHNIDVTGWTERSIIGNDIAKSNSPSHTIRHNPNQSTVTIKNGPNYGINDYSYFYRGNAIDLGYYYLGTKMKIDPSPYSNQKAGFFFNGDELGAGYFIEVCPTADLGGADRESRNEVLFYSRKSNGDVQRFGGEEQRVRDAGRGDKKGAVTTTSLGVTEAVIEDRWFEIDVVFDELPNGDHSIIIEFNGAPSMQVIVPNGSGWKHSRVSRFGFFARGRAAATFEYAYGMTQQDPERLDGVRFLDRAYGGYYGDRYVRDVTYRTRLATRRVRKRWTKYMQKFAQRFFDDFGPVVHEIREMDVRFDVDAPVLNSKIYMSNESQAVCPEYQSNPFGAKFLLANTTRNTAVVHGEDELTAPGSTINQKCLIFGRAVVQKEAGTITKKDEWAIKRRGEIELEFSNKWIQSEDDANRLGDWIVTQWARDDSMLTVEVFGNPLFELTDVVSVQYRDLESAIDKFFVTGITTSFEAGVKTTLELRRV